MVGIGPQCLRPNADRYLPVDAGKSTMLGVLVKGGLDDGRGKARVNLFRHKHEVESGRTSSVGMEIMGFDVHGEIVSSKVPGRKLSWEEIGKQSVCLSCQEPLQWLLNVCRRKLLALPIWQGTNAIFGPQCLDSSAAAPTTVCSWWRRTMA